MTCHREFFNSLLSETGSMPHTRKPTYLQLCCEEPYRIFFPLGVLVGISGVSLWPLFFAGIHKFYPGVMHARLMIEGFLGAFIIGFLSTAGPRLTGTPHFSRGELWTLLGLFAGVVAMHIALQPFAGDALFLALLLTFAVRMRVRFARRETLPPPTFVLVALGFLNAIVGTTLLLAGAIGGGSPRCAYLGAMLINQGFVLSLVLGIGGFLFPRILEMPRPELPDSRTPPPGWWPTALLAAGAGLVIVASFVAEVFSGTPRAAGIVRFVVAAAFLISQLGRDTFAPPRQTIPFCLRAALAFIVLGLLFPAFWPAQRVAGLHVIFIGGFSLVTFTVATRVVLGHSGFSHLFLTRLPFLIISTVLLVSAMVLRIAGDFVLPEHNTLLSWASHLWMIAVAVWSWSVLPKVRIADPEEE
jgi:uncharacterized protein involved in response to NO